VRKQIVLIVAVTMALMVAFVGCGKKDVYVVGVQKNEKNIDVATLWKNGIPQRLSDGKNGAGAESVFVSGKDVYVAGDEGLFFDNVATLWKNGIFQSLSDGSKKARAKSVFVK